MSSEADNVEDSGPSPNPELTKDGSEIGDGDGVDGQSVTGGSQAGDEPTAQEDEEGTEINNDIEAFNDEISKIQVDAPSINLVSDTEFMPEDFPESYRENTTKEKLVLAYAENFRRQYVHLYRDRKPLLLNPVNECGVEKFACTSLKPTQLPYEELYDWDGAAEFVSDYLNFETLNPAYELPTRLLSSPTVLKRQRGNCFEYSMLLCSLLLGAGYDAYVVSGYATRETCQMDETREICPLLKKKEEVKAEEKKKQQRKYTVKPAKDLRSKYELKMAERQEQEEQRKAAQRIRDEEDRLAELEKPPADSLYGLRVHSWVLVLKGKREVPETFFIEPFTGIAHPPDSSSYLGIESLWNHQNYWVNMQDCSEGCKNLKYDLGDCALWEFLLPSNDKPLMMNPEDAEDLGDILDDEDPEEEVEKHLDVPPSWIMPIKLETKEFHMRCPMGKKTKYYKRAKLDKFAHYLMKDGLVSRLSVFNDKDLKDLVQVKEFYAHRQDCLLERIINHKSGWITEVFAPGRSAALREHQYKGSAPGPENERTMVFYNEARVDGLQKRVETPTSMTEHFKDRDDFLYYRFVEFGKRPMLFGPADTPTHRPILKMVEKYHRNAAKAANEDVAELVFLVVEEPRIQLTYHTDDAKISASSREFLVPPGAEEKGSVITMTADMHSTFQVEPADNKKQVEVYQMLLQLMAALEKCKDKVRNSETEVKQILKERDKEESMSQLEISVYDTMRNDKVKQQRKELERMLSEEKKRKDEMDLDYLAPFLAQLKEPEQLDLQSVTQLKEKCLKDLKTRLIDKANLIQERFEKEKQQLQKKQTEYQKKQVSLTKEEEDKYLNECSELMFRIHILEVRLARHKEMAPFKFRELQEKLQSDPRLRNAHF